MSTTARDRVNVAVELLPHRSGPFKTDRRLGKRCRRTKEDHPGNQSGGHAGNYEAVVESQIRGFEPNPRLESSITADSPGPRGCVTVGGLENPGDVGKFPDRVDLQRQVGVDAVPQKVNRGHLRVHSPGCIRIFVNDRYVCSAPGDSIQRISGFHLIKIHDDILMSCGQSTQHIREIAESEGAKCDHAYTSLNPAPPTLDLGLGFLQDGQNFVSSTGKLLADVGESNVSTDLFKKVHSNIGFKLGQLL